MALTDPSTLHLEESFSVPGSPAETWGFLNDVPAVVQCIPGATFLSCEGKDRWLASVRVAFGPIGLRFDAEVRRTERDDARRSVVLLVDARERRGRGGALATIRSNVSPSNDGSAIVSVATEFAFHGALAATFASNSAAVSLMSRHLTGRFAERLAAALEVSSKREGRRHVQLTRGRRLRLGFRLLRKASLPATRVNFGRHGAAVDSRETTVATGVGDEIDIAQLGDVASFERLAEQRMSNDLRFIIQGGAGSGVAVRANAAGWQRWGLRSRCLVDVSERDTSATILGHRLKVPVLIAPFAWQSLCHPDGELATARASADAGTIMVLSGSATRSPEEVGQAGPFWMQLGYQDRALTEEIVRLAVDAGATALCVTADLPVLPWWPGWMETVSRFSSDLNWTTFAASLETERTGPERRSETIATQPNFTWADLEWLSGLSPLPLVLKGVMTGEDAKLACEYGAAAIVVSNHGGHALGDALSTAEVLPEIVAAVANRLEILVDGGIRSGADVFRALALGADAVMIARPVAWGLLLGGADGVARVLTLLHDELNTLMGLAGAREVAEINRAMIAVRER